MEELVGVSICGFVALIVGVEVCVCVCVVDDGGLGQMKERECRLYRCSEPLQTKK